MLRFAQAGFGYHHRHSVFFPDTNPLQQILRADDRFCKDSVRRLWSRIPSDAHMDLDPTHPVRFGEVSKTKLAAFVCDQLFTDRTSGACKQWVSKYVTTFTSCELIQKREREGPKAGKKVQSNTTYHVLHGLIALEVLRTQDNHLYAAFLVILRDILRRLVVVGHDGKDRVSAKDGRGNTVWKDAPVSVVQGTTVPAMEGARVLQGLARDWPLRGTCVLLRTRSVLMQVRLSSWTIVSTMYCRTSFATWHMMF